MKIKEIMSSAVCFVPQSATLQQAAQKMLDHDCGFIPVQGEGDKLCGVVTDRDIATRGIAQGLGPNDSVTRVMSEKVLYCFQDDDAKEVANNMATNQVRRLVVLDSPETKKLCGVVAVCDIVTPDEAEAQTCHQMVKSISEQSFKNNQAAQNKAA